MSSFDTEIDGAPADLYRGGLFVIDAANADLARGGFLGRGGFYVRPFRLIAGQRKPGHEHYINHLGLHLSGVARIHWRTPDGKQSGVVESRHPWATFHIRADHWHEIEAVTDVEWCCVFAKAEADRVYGDAAQIDWTLEKEHG